MKLIKLITFVLLLLLFSCDKEVIETDCDCRLVTEEIYVNTSSGLPIMDVRFTSESYSNDCDDNNKILYADNRMTKIVRCR